MKLILVAIVTGAILGLVDGGTAWFEPDARDQIGSIIMWSAMKDVIAGFLIGLFAVFIKNKAAIVGFGLLVGLGLALLVAMQPDPETGKHYYASIMIPGAIVGMLVGYFTARYGARKRSAVPA